MGVAMEREFPVRRRLVVGVCALLAVTLARAAPERAHLVLVTAHAAPIAPLPPAEVRRLFLGVAQPRDGLLLMPVHNVSDSLLYEVFLQKVVYMSARNYERVVIAQVFRAGGQRPLRYDNKAALVAALQRNPGTVTYMWAHDARRIPGIRVVQDLWRGAIE